mmetsp:Transcript_70221/g.222645  ORF Transcript_70221/g.222645 Transcript_70221/m.222645 type:complete len:375 (+) Transcript_70221:203-1327(+)
MTLEEAPTCILRAARGDKIRINYTGRLKDGTVFEDTVKIGRPGEFTLGDGNLIEGWEEGIPGMCVGERRRLVIPHKMAYGAEGKPGSIPPKATLTFDLELLAVNGEAGEFAAAPSGPQTSSSEVGVGGTPPALGVLFCDACHTFVEEFFEGWIGHMEARRKQNDNIEASGQAPPSLTYDDESEDFVQNFCSGERIGNFKWAPHIKAGCEKIMANSKREIVGEWLSTEMDPRVMPEKKDKVCNVLNKACPPVPPAPKGECEQCLAAVEDVAFSFRRLRHAHGKAPKDVVVDVLDDVCVRSWYRHYKPQAQVNACEDLLDEHSKTIFDHVSRGEPWGVLRRKLCIEQAGVCGKSQVDRFEVTRAAPEAGAAARDEL